jgi:hypothetical protein
LANVGSWVKLRVLLKLRTVGREAYMSRSNPQQDEKYRSCDPDQVTSDFHNKIGH